MAKAKYTLEKIEYSAPEITKYVITAIKEALAKYSTIGEEETADIIRSIRFTLSQCPSEKTMIACGETLLSDINQSI